MVNSKKMSKSTLAIVLLSLLLVLSLVLTSTGAWFTDWIDKTHDKDLDFGLVDITAGDVGIGIEEESEASFEFALPGDVFNLSGMVKSNSTVDTYVLLKIDTTLRLEDGLGGYVEKSVYYWDGTNYVPAITVGPLVSNAAFAEAWGSAVVLTPAEDPNPEVLASDPLTGETMYLVPASAAGVSHDFETTVEIDVLTPNYVLLLDRAVGVEPVVPTLRQDGTGGQDDLEVLLNGAEGYNIQVKFVVRAVQQRYHTPATAWAFLRTAANFALEEQQYPD